MKIGLQGRDQHGQLQFAHVTDGDHRNQTERRFRWSRRGGLVMQWIWHPVSSSMGYGDGYWRRAGVRDAHRVIEVIRTQEQNS